MQSLFKKLKTIWWRIKSTLTIYYYGNPSKKLKIIGVTGTNGKTTTATLLYRVAAQLGYKAGLISTVEKIIAGEIVMSENGKPAPATTPDSVSLTRLFSKMVEGGCEYVFMEVTSHALTQNRVARINFAGGIFTNLTQDHLDYHQNMEEYFSAKKKFFKMLPASAFALSNIDDEYGNKMLEGIRAKRYTYGFKNKADFSDKVHTKLLGEFNAYNALAVWGACKLLGFDMERVKEILQDLNPPRGRFEHFTSESGVLVVVDYAHTPDALQKVLLTIREIKSKEGSPRPDGRGKIISVFGCGGDRDSSKRSKMGRIGVALSDIPIFTSDNPRSEDPNKIIADMTAELYPEDLKKVKLISDRREAIKEAVKLAKKGDVILCAGKGHEDYQEIKGLRHHFDDMEEIKKSLQQK